jgi:hypothetical protein
MYYYLSHNLTFTAFVALSPTKTKSQRNISISVFWFLLWNHMPLFMEWHYVSHWRFHDNRNSVTSKYYKDVVLIKIEKYFNKVRPSTEIKDLYFLHDNAPAHKWVMKNEWQSLNIHRILLTWHPVTFFSYLDWTDKTSCRSTLQGRNWIGSASFQLLKGIPKENYVETLKTGFNL